MRIHLTRRAFARSMGGLGAAAMTGFMPSPFLPVTVHKASAATGRPTRLLLVYHPNGLEVGWQPSGGDSDHKLGTVLTPLEPFRNKMLVLSGFQGGIQNEVQGHAQGMTSMWTGSRIKKDSDFAYHPSIDQLIADRISAGTPFRSVELGVQSQSGNALSPSSAMIYAGAAKPIQPEDDPDKAFERLFATALADPEALTRLRREQGTVLGLAHRQLKEIAVHYGAEEANRLEQHHQHLREIEARLDNSTGRSCSQSYKRLGRSATEVRNASRNFPEVAGFQSDLAVLALGCGLTRVASLQYTHSTSGTQIPGVNDAYGIHGVMHTRTRDEKVRINKWFVTELANILKKFESYRFPDGSTLLDETIVVWGTEMAVGNHLNYPIPMIIAGGGKNSPFKLGRWMNLASRPRHTRLLVTLAQAFGLDDVKALGDFQGEADRGGLDELRR